MPTQSDQFENELLRRFHQGDGDAFEEIFNLYWNRLYRIAFKALRSHEEAEEIVQELFANLWQQHSSLKILNLSAYLNSAVRKRSIDSIRSKVVHFKYWTYYKNFMPGYRETTDEAVAYSELNSELEHAMKQLPEKSQLVFRLSKLEGRPVSEIATFLNISERAIEYHLTKSLRLLRSQLKDFILFVIVACYF